MRNSRGFTLIELLVVLVLMTLLIVMVTSAVIGQVDRARGMTLVSEARVVYNAAKAVLLEERFADGFDLSDGDTAAALSGTAMAGKDWPAQVRLSNRMNTLIAPDVVLAEEVSESAARAEFKVTNAEIQWMTYEAMHSGRVYRVEIAEGHDALVTRVRK